MKEEIIVTVTKDGEIQAEVRGVKGKRCIAITEFVSALGDANTTFKGEYYQQGTIKMLSHLKIERGNKV